MNYKTSWFGRQKRFNVPQLFSVLIIIFFGIALIHKLGTVPNLEIDEVTYMNEIRSLVKYGTDIHGLSWPVYFAGIFGYGQSVEYAYFALPLIKVIGFSIAKVRLPMVLLTLLTMAMLVWLVYDQEKQKSLGFWLMLSLSCSPWIFISARWILDCNIAPVTFVLGLILLCQAWRFEARGGRIACYTLSALLIAFSVAGYMAGWLYIPIVLILVVIYALKRHVMSEKVIVSYGILILACVMPLIAFAYNFLIVKRATPGHFFWFSYPPMPILRGTSFINFQDPHLFKLMFLNFITGINNYISGNDGLAWNSVGPYGVVFPFLLILAILGILTPRDLLNENTYHFKNIIIISLIAFLPLMFVITPNYNHWNFVNWLLAILIGFGFYYLQERLANKLAIVIALTTAFTMLMFVNLGYYGRLNNGTSYFTSRDVSRGNLRTIDHLLKPKNKHSPRLFILDLRVKSLQAYAMLADVQPISNQTMLSRSDDKQNFDLINMSSHHRYGNIYDSSLLQKKYRKGDYLLVRTDDQGLVRSHDGKFMVKENVQHKESKYRVIQRLSYMNIPFMLLRED
ncbi:hypothetical protein RA086_06825 [Lactiplantibacillus sp. WILCCON 0030]|uniref:Glycosyltransferase RgtA/B/C/D-like domain-containing protein n=1 Tax=Lactiplantibacillus brownii TaxID=3069269 RepID=A0ABU1A8P7_9LACO|nr:hypothetical protein [Lactiplantibacillus brownii]MDQ7937339.1 hypothetical protein [Lactiplantibacillus brownii]